MGNHKPHVSKTLRLAIMKCSRLKNKAISLSYPAFIKNYKKQQNLATKLKKQFEKRMFR